MLIKKRFIVCIIVFVFMFGLNLVNAETEGCMNKNVSNFEENISLDDNYDDFSFNLEDNYVQNFNDSGFVLNVDNVTMFYRDGSRINVTLKDVNGIPSGELYRLRCLTIELIHIWEEYRLHWNHPDWEVLSREIESICTQYA